MDFNLSEYQLVFQQAARDIASGRARAELWSSQDQKEGVSAFIEKRKPEWKNA